MIRSLTLVSLSAAFLVTALPACSGSVVSDPPTASAVDQAVSRAPIGAATHGRLKHIGEALGQVDLRADQRVSLEALAAEAEVRQGPALKAKEELSAIVASQVEAGAIDRALLQPKIDALVVALRAQQPGDRAAFEKLHDTLDPTQRKAFVVALKSTFHGPMGAGMKEHGGHSIAQWAADLALTDDQQSGLKELFHAGMGEHHGDGKEGMARGHALLDAFTGDTFRFDDVQPAEDPQVHVTKMTTHVLDLAEKALPLLTPEQRALAAAKVRLHAGAMP